MRNRRIKAVTQDHMEKAETLYKANVRPVKMIAELVGVSPTIIYKMKKFDWSWEKYCENKEKHNKKQNKERGYQIPEDLDKVESDNLVQPELQWKQTVSYRDILEVVRSIDNRLEELYELEIEKYNKKQEYFEKKEKERQDYLDKKQKTRSIWNR